MIERVAVITVIVARLNRAAGALAPPVGCSPIVPPLGRQVRHPLGVAAPATVLG